MFPLDTELFNTLHSLTGQSGLLDWLFVLLASWLPWVIGIAAVIVIVRLRPWRHSVWMVLATGLTLILARGIVTPLLHELILRTRPFEALSFTPLIMVAHGNSFPSGHATAFFALAFVLFYENRKRGWWFIGFALVNALARVVVGVHYPSDILAGALVALVSAFAIHALIKNFAPKEVRLVKTGVEGHAKSDAEEPAVPPEPPAVDAVGKI